MIKFAAAAAALMIVASAATADAADKKRGGIWIGGQQVAGPGAAPAPIKNGTFWQLETPNSK
jgi:hypothetical protein